MEILFETQISQLARAADDSAGYLTGVKLALTKAPVNIDNNTVLADLVAHVADYTGYAAVVLTWEAPSVADDGTVEVTSQTVTFRPTAPTTVGNQIYNLYIADGAGLLLYFACLISTAPLPMESSLDLVKVTVRYRPATNTLAVLIS